jgi:hypothetical protein
MYTPSDAWIEAQKQYLAPEGFIELSCYIPEIDETLVYTKRDLMRFTHRQSGCLISGTLPKNHIEFSLDNKDGKWNPNSPRGLERFLSERLRITLRYGFDIYGNIEWIPGGVFYLSEWKTSTDGLMASFVARDVLEYMIDTEYTGEISGSLYDVVMSAISAAGIPEDAGVRVSEELGRYQIAMPNYDKKSSIAEILQKCANAAGCVMYQDRKGTLVIEKPNYQEESYTVPLSISYSYPKVELSRPLKDVSVSCADGVQHSYSVGDKGQTQTVNNNFITAESQAIMVAKWVADALQGRRTINGDFRGDPRLDVFDVIQVENKYGIVTGVTITEITYNFTGAFRATYSGQVRGTTVSVYCGDVFTGEVS